MGRLNGTINLIIWPGGRDPYCQLRGALDVSFRAPHYFCVHTGTIFICVRGHCYLCAHTKENASRMLARRQAGQVWAGSTPQIKQKPYKTLRNWDLGSERVDALLGSLWPMANGMWLGHPV